MIRARTSNSIDVDNEGPKLTLGHFDRSIFANCKSNCVVVAHAQNRNVFPFVPEVLASNLLKASLSKTESTIVYDTHGVPAFEIFGLSEDDSPVH